MYGKTLAERVTALREKKGWRKVDLSRAAGLRSSSTLSEIESGENLHSPQLPQIAKALGVDVVWLKTGQGDPQPVHVETKETKPNPSLPSEYTELFESMAHLPAGTRVRLLASFYDQIEAAAQGSKEPNLPKEKQTNAA